MQSFEETRADKEFQQHIAQARGGWMTEVPSSGEPDLGVEGLRSSLLAKFLSALRGRRD
jgi:hypothetical protein